MGVVSDPIRYKAFLSYSHRDSKSAVWLHRRLESYRLPRALRHADGEQRLNPVFRDRDELASSAALSESIQRALDASAALVVICSPAAVASRWVNEEVRYFRRSHPSRKVLAYIVDGDPGADPATAPGRACFPSNVVLKDVDDPGAGSIEPAAPDARKEADGREAAFLKLAAGLLDVPFATLRQRELRRQQQRWAFVSAGSLALSAVFAVLAWQAMVARDVAREAQARAELEADTARQTSDFMVSLFRVSEPGEARGNSITAREVLDRGVERIESVKIAKPVVKSRLLGTMGQVYAGLGLYPRAQELLALAETLAAAPAASAEETAQRFDVQWELADLLYAIGDYAAANAVIARIAVPPGAAADERQRRARLLNLRADLALQEGLDEPARALYAEALGELDPLGNGELLQRARSLGGLGRLEFFAGNSAQAGGFFADAHALLLGFYGPDHPDTLVALNLRASAAYQARDAALAERLWTEALASGKRIYGEAHPEVGTFLTNLALLRLEACEFERAETMLRETLAIDRAKRQQGLDDLAYTLNSLALARLGRGASTEAEAVFLEALAIARAHHHRMLGPVLNNLADLYCASGRGEAARPLLAEALAANNAEYGAAHWRTQQATLTAAFCGAQGARDSAPAALEAIVGHWGEGNLYSQRALQQMRAIAPRDGDAGATRAATAACQWPALAPAADERNAR